MELYSIRKSCLPKNHGTIHPVSSCCISLSMAHIAGTKNMSGYQASCITSYGWSSTQCFRFWWQPGVLSNVQFCHQLLSIQCRIIKCTESKWYTCLCKPVLRGHDTLSICLGISLIGMILCHVAHYVLMKQTVVHGLLLSGAMWWEIFVCSPNRLKLFTVFLLLCTLLDLFKDVRGGRKMHLTFSKWEDL